MYQITDSILKSGVYSALTEPTREFQQRISFGEGSGANFIKHISFIKGITKIEISQEGNSDSSGLVLGSCCASSCVAEFYNPDETYNYAGKTMFIECGIKLEDGSFFYIPCGYYKVDKPETDDDWRTVSITAYDCIDEMTGKWNTSLSMPSTAYLLFEEIATRYGLALDVENGVLAEMKSRTVTEAQALTLTAYTEREVCGFLAGLFGANARINTVGKLAVKRYQNSPTDDFCVLAAVQWQNGFKKTSEEEFVVNSVTSGIDDAVFTAGTGAGISFSNPIITEDEISVVYNVYAGMSFQPSSCEWRGNPCVECGDTVAVTDRNGNSYTVLVASQVIDLTGGLSMNTHCPGGDSEISFDTVDERTRAALNRQYTALQQAIIDASNALNGARGGYYEVLDNDNDGNPDGWLIKQYQDGTGGLMRANYAGLGLSTDGGKTYRTAIGFDGINADAIVTGKVKAEFIETDNLSVGIGNVKGLSSELGTLLGIANVASTDASLAVKTATTADTNATSALSVANSANGVIAKWCYDNNTTYIDGANIFTGTITAKQIGANEITADKLSVGNGKLVDLYYNGDFSKNSSKAVAWDGYNTALSKQNGVVYAQFTLNNLLAFEDSEFYTTKNWVATNCVISKPFENVDFIKVTPNNKTDWAIIAIKAYLEKGKKYSISAQINPLDWTSTDSSYTNTCIGIHCNGTFYHSAYTSYSNFSPATGEMNVEWIFEYTGNSGNVDIGLFFRGMLSSSSNPVSVNIAWIAVSEAGTRATRFLSSKKDWLKSAYKSACFINGGNYINTAEKFIAYNTQNFTTVYGSQLQLFFQKRQMEYGKRYVLMSRLKVADLTTVSYDSLLGVWGQGDGAYVPKEIAINGKNERGYITIKYVFDCELQTGLHDVGFAWRGLLDSISQPCVLRFAWMQLYQDDTAETGFYCSDASWLEEKYKESNLIIDSDDISDYNNKPALSVYNNNLYFFGDVQSASGQVGFLDYTPDALNSESYSQYYEDASATDLKWQYSISSSYKVEKPSGILDGTEAVAFSNTYGKHLRALHEYFSFRTMYELDYDGDFYRSIVSSAGLHASDGSGSVLYSSNGITINGSTTLTNEDLIALKKIVE